MSLFRSSARPEALKPTDYDHKIILRDTSVPNTLSSGDTTYPSSPPGPIHTHGSSLRHDFASRKWAKNHHGQAVAKSPNVHFAEGRSSLEDDVNEERRGHSEGLMTSFKTYGQPDSAIDILFENQRGGLLCGIPLFSARALGNLDPAPWTNSANKTSATNPSNAQVPDPHWKWAWKEWTINMGEEADEEGWQYSFAFAKRFSWHGASWWNSFVRRRVWTRKRIKKIPSNTVPETNMLNENYFAIHPAHGNQSIRSRVSSVEIGQGQHRMTELGLREIDAHLMSEDLMDITSLMNILRFSRIDREKMEAVENFIKHGGNELAHLEGQMHDIMSLFIFQASRRLLLAHLIRILDIHSGEVESSSDPNAQQKVECLQKAVKAAEDEVRKLEYWSDVKEMANSGETKGAVDSSQGWDSDDWAGIEGSGPHDVRASPVRSRFTAWNRAKSTLYPVVHFCYPPAFLSTAHVRETSTSTAGASFGQNTLAAAIHSDQQAGSPSTLKTCLLSAPLVTGNALDLVSGSTMNQSVRQDSSKPNLENILGFKAPKKEEPSSEKIINKIADGRLYELKRNSQISAVRLEYNTEREEARSWTKSTWMQVLRILEDNTTTDQTWLEKAFEVLIPDDAAATLLYGVDDTIWEIAGIYGCPVEAGSAGKRNGEYQRFYLSGPATSLKQALTDIRHTSPKVLLRIQNSRDNPGVPKILEPKPFHNVKQRLHQRGGIVRDVRVTSDEPLRINRLNWTEHSFVEHVSTIVSAETAFAVAHAHPKDPHPVREVIRELLDLFAEEESTRVFSRKAFKIALRYMINHNEMVASRILFTRVDRTGLRLDPEVFNIMLRQAGKQEDSHSFLFLLSLMLQRHIRPNADTWIALLKAVKDPHMIHTIATSMRQKGMLQHVPTLRGLVENSVPFEVDAAMMDGFDLEAFCSHMDLRYGPKWLNNNTASATLNALGTHGLISQYQELVDFMLSRFVKPDMVNVNIVLKHCKRMRNMEGAITFLKYLPAALKLRPDEITFHTLFECAWNLQYFNVARVVWKYACYYGSTNYRMRCLLEESIMTCSNRIASHLSMPAGALFVTAPIDRAQPDEIYRFEDICEDVLTALESKVSACDSVISSSRNVKRQKVLSWLIDQQCHSNSAWRPAFTLRQKLSEAILIDKFWATDSCIERFSIRSAKSIMSNGVRIQKLSDNDEASTF